MTTRRPAVRIMDDIEHITLALQAYTGVNPGPAEPVPLHQSTDYFVVNEDLQPIIQLQVDIFAHRPFNVDISTKREPEPGMLTVDVRGKDGATIRFVDIRANADRVGIVLRLEPNDVGITVGLANT